METPDTKFNSSLGGEPKLLGFIKNLLLFVFLIVLIVGSFWLSYVLGKRILMPVKKLPERKIEVAIPAPPPAIAALQALEEDETAETEEVTPTTGAKVIKPIARVVSQYQSQAGYFLNKSNAAGLVAKLRENGFTAVMEKAGKGWRVLAKASAKALKAKGFDAVTIN